MQDETGPSSQVQALVDASARDLAALDQSIELGQGHWIEAQHAAFIMAEIVQDHLHRHPVIQQTPELKAISDRAVEALCDLYQAVGSRVPPAPAELV